MANLIKKTDRKSPVNNVFSKCKMLLSKTFKFEDYLPKRNVSFQVDDIDVLGRLKLKRLIDRIKYVKDLSNDYVDSIYECIRSNVDVNNFSINHLKHVRVLDISCTDSNVYQNINFTLYTCFYSGVITTCRGRKCKDCKWFTTINIDDKYIGVHTVNNKCISMERKVNIYLSSDDIFK